jgi:multiple sugar transport system substrate-binding protein
MRLRTIVIVTIALLSTILAGCGLRGSGSGSNQSASKVDLSGTVSGSITFQTWSLKSGFSPYFESLIQAFEAKYPGTKINWQDQPGEGYADKITSQITAGSLPDVVNLPPDIAHAAVAGGALMELSQNDPTFTQDYVAGGRDAYTYSDLGLGSYGFPWYLGTTISYWNLPMLKGAGVDTASLPTTFDQLLAVAKQVHDSTGGKDFVMTRLPSLGDIEGTGTSIVDASGKKFAFNTPAAAAMLQKYVDAYKAGYMPEGILNNNYAGDSSLFVKGQGGYTASTGAFIPENVVSNPGLFTSNVIATPSIGTPPLFVQGLSVSAKTKNAKLALTFAEYVTNAENQINFTTKTAAKGFFPGAVTQATAFTQSDGTNAGNAQVLAFKALQSAVNQTPPIWTDAMNQYLGQQTTAAMSGQTSAQQALDNAVTKANQLLKG